jgi:UDP-N-acetylmuramate dehydrogenase
MRELEIHHQVPLRRYTTLRAGGAAEVLAECVTVDQLIEAEAFARSRELPITVLGSGSNVLPSDDGVPGLVIVNLARSIRTARSGEVVADTGAAIQELFLKCAQNRLAGLEFAVGIPGTIGGALVSNAGAYRSSVSEFLTGIEIVWEGKRQWVDPAWMQFAYRDSILRRPNAPKAIMLRVTMKLPVGDSKAIYDEARDYQRQRISKQPPSPSAGSFFKNVVSHELAEALVTLPASLKKAGVVPAGYLIELAGLKGFRVGGAMLGIRHANFIVNVRNASASDIRRLASYAKATVREKFAVELEEEVLYLGNWANFSA